MSNFLELVQPILEIENITLEEYTNRVLREKRNYLLQETDWEVQRNTEKGIDNTELITYRNALRDLPQEIEQGNVEPPTLDEQGNLVFDNWPTRGETI